MSGQREQKKRSASKRYAFPYWNAYRPLQWPSRAGRGGGGGGEGRGRGRVEGERGGGGGGGVGLCNCQWGMSARRVSAWRWGDLFQGESAQGGCLAGGRLPRGGVSCHAEGLPRLGDAHLLHPREQRVRTGVKTLPFHNFVCGR